MVGYTGMGGREFFCSDHSEPIGDGDLYSFARAVETYCSRYESDPQQVLDAGVRASQFIQNRYTSKGLEEDLSEFFGVLLCGG